MGKWTVRRQWSRGLEVVTGTAEEGGYNWTRRLWRWGLKLRCRISCCRMRGGHGVRSGDPGTHVLEGSLCGPKGVAQVPWTELYECRGTRS